MKSADVLFTLLLCDAIAKCNSIKAHVTIGANHNSYVRCNCPLDSNIYPTILEEIDYCQKVNEGYLMCDDAILSCEKVMLCWTPTESESFVCPCSWKVTTDAKISLDDKNGVQCSSTTNGEQTCEVSTQYAHFIGHDGNTMVEYCNKILADQGAICSNPIYVRDSVGAITQVDVYPNNDNTANSDPQETSVDDVSAGSSAKTLPRCPNTDPSGGSDMWQVSSTGSGCATLLYSSDFRTIGGNLMTYSASVNDSETCEAEYKQEISTLFTSSTLFSGTCKSYYVKSGVACLSSCYHAYDCYVGKEETYLDYASCAAAAGVEEHITVHGDDSKDETANLCYEYDYSKGPFKESPPEQRRCNDSSQKCVSWETVQFGDTTTSSGGCSRGMSNFCESMKGGSGEMTRCVECDGDLCNPIYSYNGADSRTKAGFVSLILAAAAMFIS